ncbi:hypothetical protein NESM_000720700 [Novymonas esmeraldas]|uniref:Uncharacterized protein n=1 Tax=Novymonas esmeraldas TaxID=1808958 RepID=A0AAW0EW94_9TRYP
MPPKKAQAEQQRSAKTKGKSQRVRVTNKALESRQFSSVRLPRTSEVPAQKVDVDAMYSELAAGHGTAAAAAAASPSSSAAVFDPIVGDSMFTIVARSKYWPPPSLEVVHAATGHDHGDGFDAYDRRDDDRQARAERVKMVRGEVNHPRGKPRKNTIVALTDSDDDDDDRGGK